jgi:putative membrane protein
MNNLSLRVAAAGLASGIVPAGSAMVAQAQSYGGPGMMGGWGYGGYGGFGGFGMIVWLIILIAIIAGVVWLVRMIVTPGGTPAASARRSPALDVLEERYARGEINRDEYLQKKGDMLG